MIELKITANSVEELNTKLVGILNIGGASTVVKEEVSVPETVTAAPKKQRKPATKPVEEKSSETPTEADAPALTIEEIRGKVRDAVTAKGKDFIKEKLAEFNVSKVTNLPEEDYAKFYKELEDALNE